jgi:hypothetical protein
MVTTGGGSVLPLGMRPKYRSRRGFISAVLKSPTRAAVMLLGA